jgi:AcrR family transcriptional regulator
MRVVMERDADSSAEPGAPLPVLGAPPRERADAARNRLKVLAAAERLFFEQGPECVSMDAIAAAAGVGKGTLFRRFGDRAGLARALLEERESRFQEALIRGEPPLGPGAPPRDRLIAFGEALIALLELHGPILVAAEAGAGGARFRSPVYATYRAHVTLLIREADPELDADYVADVLLAALAAELFVYQRHGREMERARIRAGWTELVRRLLP